MDTLIDLVLIGKILSTIVNIDRAARGHKTGRPEHIEPWALKIAWLALLFLLSLMWASSGAAFRYLDEKSGHDFVLVGLGVFRQNLSSVDGEALFFEDSDDGFPTGYSNRSFLDLYGEGTVYSNYHFTLKAHYDEQDPDEDFTFLLKVDRDRHFVMLGDHEQGTFEDTVFTALDQRIRGVTAHAEPWRGGATIMSGLLRGESATEELRGEGITGPYRLSDGPVVDGSESIRIETRDRNDPGRPLRSEPQTRGRDYVIDYDDAEITFRRPVDEQDFRGNPVIIVVDYQYDGPGDRYQRASGGVRVVAHPTGRIQIGGTYLNESPWENGLPTDGWDRRRQIYGTDLVATFSDRYKASLELAQSETPLLPDSRQATGLRMGFDANPIDALSIQGRFWQVQNDFLTFGNRQLANGSFNDMAPNEEPFEVRSANLDLNIDPQIENNLGAGQRSISVAAKYDLGRFQSVSAGYRQGQDNLDALADQSQIHDRQAVAAFKSMEPDGTHWLVGSEHLESEDESSLNSRKDRTQRLIGAVRHPVGTFGRAGEVTTAGVYQYEQFDDRLDPENDTRTHDLIGRAEIAPWKTAYFYLEQAEQFLYEERYDGDSLRVDTSVLGIDGRINRYLDLDASVRYRRENALVTEREDRTEYGAVLLWGAQWLPVLKTDLKAEYLISETEPSRMEDERTLLGGEVSWNILPKLIAQMRYQMEWDESRSDLQDEESSFNDDFRIKIDYQRQDRFSLFGYYRIENDRLDTPLLPETRSQVTTYMLGAKYKLTERFDLLAAWREKILTEAIEDRRSKGYAEIGYQINRFFKTVLGYERFQYDSGDNQGEYDADVAYFTLIGTL